MIVLKGYRKEKNLLKELAGMARHYKFEIELIDSIKEVENNNVTDLDSMKKAELIDYINNKEYDIDISLNKAELIDSIKEVEK
jgi:acyl carrier protein